MYFGDPINKSKKYQQQNNACDIDKHILLHIFNQLIIQRLFFLWNEYLTWMHSSKIWWIQIKVENF